MNEPIQHPGGDSRADSIAIFCLILIAVSTAVFWVSHQ
ncbi:hypothetical protein WP8S17C03_36770 [Metapseudomonas otitidis]|uniref:Uncharacterized protein n=1 Tax=Metapseudomonas otitidis TaxID=319939 RepID=A0A6S5RQ43_9GAMM|nr:hypothetical protein WP8S17C03_36770 [Pseudomonas otitidis]